MRNDGGVLRAMVHTNILILFYKISDINLVYSACTGFDTVMQYIYSGDETVVISLGDLDLLFEVFRLADKVAIKCARSSS